MLKQSTLRSLPAALILCALAAPALAQQPAATAMTVAFTKDKPAAIDSMTDPIRALVLPVEETTLASPVSGRISKVHVDLGSSFKAGQVLVSLDCQEPRSKLAIGQAELAAATSQNEAMTSLNAIGQASILEVSLAASAVSKAKAQIGLYQHQISQCSIRAPWSGNAVKLHVQSHMATSAGQPMIELVRSGVLLLKMNVPSKLLANLKPGQEFQVKIDETGKAYPAKVRRINSRIDAVSQTVEIEATMIKTYQELLPGMSGYAQFAGMS